MDGERERERERERVHVSIHIKLFPFDIVNFFKSSNTLTL